MNYLDSRFLQIVGLKLYLRMGFTYISKLGIKFNLVLILLFFSLKIASGQKHIKKLHTISQMMAVNQIIFFAANDQIHGEELWVTNGTSAGTHLLKDINQDYLYSSPQDFFSFNGFLFFSASTTGFGRELWRSDGTTEGTTMVIDLSGTQESNPKNFTICNGLLYFTTDQGGLYKTDGTAAGTNLVDTNMYQGYIQQLSPQGDRLYYIKEGSSLSWTDGTSANSLDLPEDDETSFYSIYSTATTLFALRASTGAQRIIKLYALENETPNWKLLVEFNSPDSWHHAIANFTTLSDKLFFSYRSEYNNVDELWVSDGTVTGTSKVKSFDWYGHSYLSWMENFIEYNGELYFKATSSTRSLWKSDGTTDGTVFVHEAVFSAPDYGAKAPSAVSNGLLFFSGEIPAGNGAELCTTDGTTNGTNQLFDISPAGPSRLYFLTSTDDLLYFVTKNTAGDFSLWNTTPSPLLAIKGPYDNIIPSGGSASFEKILVNGCIKMECKIINHGTKEFLISRVDVTGSDFFLNGDLPEIIEPGQEVVIKVYFNPSVTGRQKSILSVYSNDLRSSKYLINLEGDTFASNQTGFCANSRTDLTKQLKITKSIKSISLSNNSIEEMQPSGTIVGSLSLTDSSGEITYDFINGVGDANNEQFVVDGNLLRASQSFDYSSAHLYTVRIKATNSSNNSQEDYFSINIINKPATMPQGNCENVFQRLDYGFTDIEVNSFGQLFAISNNGGIFRSIDEGISWKPINSGVQNRLTRITFKNTVGYIVGEQIMLKSEDGGASWFQLYLPFDSDSYFNSYSSFFLTETSGYVSDSHGEVLYTADGGRTWEKRSKLFGDGLTNLWFLNQGSGIAIQGSSLVKTSNGGKTWSHIDLTSIIGYFRRPLGIWFLDQNNGFLLGEFGLLRTNNGGNTWTKTTQNFESVYSIEFTSNSDGYVYGGSDHPKLYKTSNGGNSWETIYLPGQGRVTGLAKHGASGNIYSSHSGYDVGRAVNYSTDNGDTWQVSQSLLGGYYSAIDFPTEKIGYAFGSFLNNGSFLNYKTYDGGASWHELPLNHEIVSSYFIDANKGFLSGDYYLYKTIDGGETVEEVILPDGPPGQYKLYGYDENLIFAYGWNSFYRTEDGGDNWEFIETDLEFNISDVHFITPLIGYRITFFSSLEKTIDGGITWNPLHSVDLNELKLAAAVFFVDENIGFKGGAYLAKSVDGGLTWNDIVTPIKYNIIDLFFMDELHGYAATNNRFFYETLDGGMTWKETYLINYNEVRSVQFKNNNIYFAGDRSLGLITRPTFQQPPLPGYIFGQSVVCLGDVQLYHLPPNQYNTNYEWKVTGTIVEDNGDVARVHYPEVGDYKFTVSLLDNCAISEPRELTVTVRDLPDPIIEGAEIVKAKSKETPYTIANYNPMAEYLWNIPGANSFTKDGKDKVLVNWGEAVLDVTLSVIATDYQSFCRSKENKQITILEADPIEGPGEDNTTGIENQGEHYLSVYPNPTDGKVFIKSPSFENFGLIVYDMMGREYARDEIKPNTEYTLDLYNAPSGIYLLKVENLKANTIHTNKILKK